MKLVVVNSLFMITCWITLPHSMSSLPDMLARASLTLTFTLRWVVAGRQMASMSLLLK